MPSKINKKTGQPYTRGPYKKRRTRRAPRKRVQKEVENEIEVQKEVQNEIEIEPTLINENETILINENEELKRQLAEANEINERNNVLIQELLEKERITIEKKAKVSQQRKARYRINKGSSDEEVN